MIINVLWESSIYDFLRTVERLGAMLSIYQQADDKQRISDAISLLNNGAECAQVRDSAEDLREEVLFSMKRQPREDAEKYAQLLEHLIVKENGRLLVRPSAVKKADSVTQFHVDERMCVTLLPSGELQYIRRLPRNVDKALLINLIR